MANTASDYLVAYINEPKSDKWICKVIRTFFQKENEKKVHALAEDLLGINEYVVSEEENRVVDTSNDSIVLKELLHKSGVNALAENQKIKFNSQVNVIYGLNGTGKSSYFRIINEMLGGENETPIRPNIYADENKPVSVELKYLYKGSDKTVLWDGKLRGISDLTSMRVFDSAYTRDLLRKRTSDELVVKPYGLHIFADLVSYIDQITEEADRIIMERLESKPIIDTKEMLPEIAKIFNESQFRTEYLKAIEEIISKGDIEENSLENKRNEIESLRLGDPKDKIVILKTHFSEVEKLKKHLTECVSKGNGYAESASSDIASFRKLTVQSNIFKQKLDVLKSIPGTETDAWKEFIAKGIEYRNSHISEEECPFCHQKYSEHAKEIVDAYVLFLQNNSLIELDRVSKSIENNILAINKWNVLIDIDKNQWSKDLSDKIESAIERIQGFKNSLVNMLKSRTENELDKLDFTDLIALINSYADELSQKISLLSDDSNGRAETVKSLEKTYSEMKSRHSVVLQKKEIMDIFALYTWASEREKIVSSVSNQRKRISNLSKKAHNELLTEQLQEEFITNLKKLNVSNIDIELLGKNNNGTQQTELTIRKNKDVTTILSEGEQKATALALYLAEITLSKNKSTIVFDDPVNSLDHRMMQDLADLLMSIDNQIIVFTHNKMFLDCFECTKFGHICKGIESACSKSRGKHIYLYETQSEGKNRKGVIIEKNAQTLKYYVDEVGKMLKESPFTKFDDVCIKLRRGVETAIDEVVFNNQTPTKLSNKNSRINWDALKKISNDESLIDGLQEIHNRVSGGELHNGSEREDNPLDKEEIEKLHSKLKVLCNIA